MAVSACGSSNTLRMKRIAWRLRVADGEDVSQALLRCRLGLCIGHNFDADLLSHRRPDVDILSWRFDGDDERVARTAVAVVAVLPFLHHPPTGKIAMTPRSARSAAAPFQMSV
jgi:hypothetical protein